MRLETISRMLGHKSLQMTLRYAAVMPATLRQEFETAFATIDEEHRATAQVRVMLSPEAHIEAQVQWKESLFVDLGIGWCGLTAYHPCPTRLACHGCPNFIPDKERLPLLKQQRANLIELRGLGDSRMPQARQPGFRREVDDAVDALDRNITDVGAKHYRLPSRIVVRNQETEMTEITMLMDELTGAVLLEGPDRVPPEVVNLLTAVLGPAQEFGCARPIELLPPPSATEEEIAARPSVRIAGYYHNSLAEGPGRRSSVLFQSCPLGCRQCWVPQLHSPDAGALVPVDRLAVALLNPAHERDGISVLGGEPLCSRMAYWHWFGPCGHGAVLTSWSTRLHLRATATDGSTRASNWCRPR
jgi:hypothetical protein